MAAGKLESPACPVCLHERSTPCYLEGPHKMYRCERCRNAFVAPMPEPDFLVQYYSTYHLGRGEKSNYDQEDKMKALHPAELALVLRHTGGKPGRLLDLGCGKGYFLKHAADAGIECVGLEISDTAAAFARERLGLNVIAGDIHQKNGELGLFDTITMWGVIEHIPDPVEVLRSARACLKPGGTIIVNTGTGDDWLDRLLPGVNQWYNPPQHLFVFSVPGLRECLSRAGYDVSRVIPSFDRTPVRLVVRSVRGAVTAALLRAVSAMARLNTGEFQMTKFPMGHHQVAIARRPA